MYGTLDIDKNLLSQTIYDDMNFVAEPLEKIMRAYNVFNEYNRGDYRITIESNITKQFTQLYNLCIAIKSVKLIQDFIIGNVRLIDMDEKNKDKTDKSKEERDVIDYIRKNYSGYAKMSAEIVESVSQIIPPIRETSNLKLRNEINKVRFAFGNNASVSKTQNCTAKENTDVFRDIYFQYVLNQGHLPYNNEIMYTGINTLDLGTQNELGSQYEIYVLVDSVDKKQFDSKKFRCKFQDDILTNEFNHLLYSKVDNLVNTAYRSYENYDKSFEGVNLDEVNNIKPPPPPNASNTTLKGGKYRVNLINKKLKSILKKYSPKNRLFLTRKTHSKYYTKPSKLNSRTKKYRKP